MGILDMNRFMLSYLKRNSSAPNTQPFLLETSVLLVLKVESVIHPTADQMKCYCTVLRYVLITVSFRFTFLNNFLFHFIFLLQWPQNACSSHGFTAPLDYCSHYT